MIEDLLPSDTRAVEAFHDPAEAQRSLFPEEISSIASAVPKRRNEYATVRMCARLALASLGVPAGPLLKSARGAPLWPHQVVGSMTHCHGYRAAVVAHAADHLGLGIDAEPNEPLSPDVLEYVSLPWERTHLAALRTIENLISFDRLLFCAKEAAFKAWFPLTQSELDFSEASVEITFDQNTASGTFSAHVRKEVPRVAGIPLDRFDGRWMCRRGLLLTAVALKAPPTRP